MACRRFISGAPCTIAFRIMLPLHDAEKSREFSFAGKRLWVPIGLFVPVDEKCSQQVNLLLLFFNERLQFNVAHLIQFVV